MQELWITMGVSAVTSLFVLLMGAGICVRKMIAQRGKIKRLPFHGKEE